MNVVKVIKAVRELSKAAKFHNTSTLYQVRRARRLHDHSGFSLIEVLFWGLTDPDIPDDDIDNFISKESMTTLQSKVNDPESDIDVEDKARFYRLCSESGFPVPETFGILEKQDSSAQPRSDPETLRIGLSDLPEGKLVAKPVWGIKGKGIVFFDKKNRGFHAEKRDLTEPELYSLLDRRTSKIVYEDSPAAANIGDSVRVSGNNDLLLQRRLLPCEELFAVSQSPSVQSVRIVTYVDEDAKPHILFARFKFVRATNDVDNFDAGHTGNLIADVDSESGKILKVMQKTVGRIGLDSITHHPDTGKPLSITLPFWPESVDLAIKGALRFKSLRTLGWDIALTPDGPVILEANPGWEIFPISPYRKPTPIGNWESLIRR